MLSLTPIVVLHSTGLWLWDLLFADLFLLLFPRLLTCTYNKYGYCRPRRRTQGQQQLQQQQLQPGAGKKGFTAKTSRDPSANNASASSSSAAATPDTYTRGTATDEVGVLVANDEDDDDEDAVVVAVVLNVACLMLLQDAVDGAGYGSTRAKGPNPALRKGPNDDLLL